MTNHPNRESYNRGPYNREGYPVERSEELRNREQAPIDPADPTIHRDHIHEADLHRNQPTTSGRTSGYVTGTNEVHHNQPAVQRAANFQEGYTYGRNHQRLRSEEALEVRDNDNAARGLLLGILLTSLVGLVVGSIFLFNQRNNQVPSTATPSRTVVPVNPQNGTNNQQPQVRERVIERTNIVPVPQQPAPAPSVNIQVPEANTPVQVPSQTAPAERPSTSAPSTTPSGANGDTTQSGSTTPNSGNTQSGTTNQTPAGVGQ